MCVCGGESGVGGACCLVPGSVGLLCAMVLAAAAQAPLEASIYYAPLRPSPAPGGTGEDDGYVLVAVHNADTGKGDLAILDARQLSAGPVAIVHLPHLLPAGLHGSFSPQVYQEDSAAAPKWAEPRPVKQI